MQRSISVVWSKRSAYAGSSGRSCAGGCCLTSTIRNGSRLRKKPMPNKYGVARREDRTYKGVVYDSKAEAKTAWELDCRIRTGEVANWSRQVPFPLVVNGIKVKTYYADFVVFHSIGQNEVVEVKGVWTQAGKLTWKLFLACYADRLANDGWKITLLQQQAHRRTRKKVV